MLDSVLLLAAASAAQPVYLECSLDRGAGVELLRMNLNEPNGTVTITNDRATWTVNAQFAVDEVIWGGDPYLYTVDRDTLKIVYSADAINMRREGVCKIPQKKKRVF
ncbi:MAG: hypothetical protein V4502_04045 [Pseudomonadota bacterium]